MFLILFLLPVLAAAQTADLVVTNARVYTAEAASPRASAIAVRGGRIIAIGGDLSAHVGPKTRRIDARGATILPGLIDSHAHMAGLGASMETLDLRGTASVERIAAMVRTSAAGRKPGEWILGRSWDQTNWGGAFPTHEPLSRAAPEQPVYLTRVDGHAGWTNRKALEAAGITASTPDPAGGRILRTSSGSRRAS